MLVHHFIKEFTQLLILCMIYHQESAVILILKQVTTVRVQFSEIGNLEADVKCSHCLIFKHNVLE